MVTQEDLKTADDLCCACAALASEISDLRQRILDFGSQGMHRFAWRLEDAADALLVEANRNYSNVRADLSDAASEELVPDFHRLTVDDDGLECEISAMKGGLLAHVCWFAYRTGELLFYDEYNLTDAAYLALVRGDSPLGREIDTAGKVLCRDNARRVCR